MSNKIKLEITPIKNRTIESIEEIFTPFLAEVIHEVFENIKSKDESITEMGFVEEWNKVSDIQLKQPKKGKRVVKKKVSGDIGDIDNSEEKSSEELLYVKNQIFIRKKFVAKQSLKVDKEKVRYVEQRYVRNCYGKILQTSSWK